SRASTRAPSLLINPLARVPDPPGAGPSTSTGMVVRWRSGKPQKACRCGSAGSPLITMSSQVWSCCNSCCPAGNPVQVTTTNPASVSARSRLSIPIPSPFTSSSRGGRCAGVIGAAGADGRSPAGAGHRCAASPHRGGSRAPASRSPGWC
ncbi:MAG: hypothetical protein ACK55Z_07265, partial [bacterium]